jgi:hypothetical protein
MEIRVGDKVMVKDWNEMIEEFGTNERGNINCRGSFVANMKGLCGRKATVVAIIGQRVYLDIEGIKNTNWVYTEEMLKPWEFTKADLKDGMILETKNGKRFMYINGKGIGTNSFILLGNYTNELLLKSNAEYNIVKVFEQSVCGSFEQVLEFGHLIWERKPKVKTLTTEKAIELLRERFKSFDEIKII